MSGSAFRLLVTGQPAGGHPRPKSNVQCCRSNAKTGGAVLRRLQPVRLSETRLAFALPAACESVVLKSNTFIPAHALAENGDERELGLCVARLQIDGGDVTLEDEALAAFGRHGPEREAGRLQRHWTRGEVLLPAGTRLALVDLAGRGYDWREPSPDPIAHVA